MGKDFGDLIKEVLGLKKLVKQEFVNVRADTEKIIHEKIKDEKYLEHTLDSLLNSILFGVGIKEFHELNDFYFTFNPENAEDYKMIYEEITEKEY
jgi:hypothetical protein